MIFHNENIDFDIESVNIKEIMGILKKENSGFCDIFVNYSDDSTIREEVYDYFHSFELHCLQSCNMNPVQRYYSQQAIRVLKNLFSTRHEKITHFSVLTSLKNCLNNQYKEVTIDFVLELLFLFRALKGTNGVENWLEEKPLAKADWTRFDIISKEVKAWMKRYPTGLDENIFRQRKKNQEIIKSIYEVTDKEFRNWEWQRENVIRDLNTLEKFISLSDDEKEALQLAIANDIPFGITPYYLSLLDLENNISGKGFDRILKKQAFPMLSCVKKTIEIKKGTPGKSLRLSRKMPSEISITRGYPMIAIFKPMQTNSRFYNAYGDKNWEINYALWEKNIINMEKIDRAIRWFDRHTEVTEVLIASDIMIFDDIMIEDILSRLADIPHIQRIRVSTRIPVILPIRITDSLIHLLSSYQIIGKREISLMVHYEHPCELTLEAMKGIQKLKKAGIQVYNQSTYTMENARRFEMAALRKQLRLIGVDPYYSFNAKKDIMEERVPIARMMQEQSEESRLAPGIDRADEAVFSIPGVGKNYLRTSQEHELIMILGDGSRVYEFYPSDVYFIHKKPFIYRDVPIYTFLNQLVKRGENINEYQSIWYYY